MVYSDLRIGAAGDRIHADDRLYSGDRGSGADGGNHVEEGISVALSGAGNFPAAHYDELCRAGRGDSDDFQGVQPVTEYRLFRGDGHRLRIGAGAVRRYSRAARTGGCPQGRAGGPRGADYGRYSGDGLHGFLRAGITVIGTKRDL